jgi:hypothetical protein
MSFFELVLVVILDVSFSSTNHLEGIILWINDYLKLIAHHQGQQPLMQANAQKALAKYYKTLAGNSTLTTNEDWVTS